jgi:hypothetical protein
MSTQRFQVIRSSKAEPETALLNLLKERNVMPDHTIFNERPESQNRAIQQLQNMGYSYVPRAEAEKKRGRLSKVLFPDVMREFLASQSYQ